MLKRPKISIIGAAGNVGASVVQWCAQKELADLVLIDLKAQVAQGKALDLTQGGAFGGFNITFEASDNYDLISDSDIVVVTAGIPRKPGQSREELVNVNAKIIKDISIKIKKYASQAIVIVVSNPLDAMLTVAKHVTEFDKHRVIGMSGVLDSSRFRANIARAAKVSIEDVSAIVLGVHTDKDMVPIVSTASVNGVPLTSMLSKNEISDIVARTKRGGAELTELIGTSAWLAPGFGVTTMVESIIKNKGRILPCSVELDGSYGISDASCLCVPVKLSQKGAEKIYELPLSQEEALEFQNAHKSYLKIRDLALKSL